MEKTIEITNPDKIIYPKQKIKKLDVIKYYVDVSGLMLPLIKERPLAVIRCHDGIGGECFFKKHPLSDKDVETFNYKGEKYFYIKDQSQLVYQAQMGSLEFHTWACSAKKIKNPDVMIFDLDPDEGLPLSKLRAAVKKVKSLLDELELVSFLKTSGGKGYHIVVPFKSSKNWDAFYDFSKKVAMLAENRWGEVFTTNIRKAERKGKIFVDYLRNNVGSTCAAPYSLRARDKATVSMPISWAELDIIKPNQVTLKNYRDYVNNSWDRFYDISQELK